MISQFFIKKYKFAFVISIIIVISGIIAIDLLPVSEYPSITPPQVSITAVYPGADAKAVENTVVSPLESAVNGVKNMLYMTSKSSDDGIANITVTFKVGSDPDMNAVNVQNRVSTVLGQLPDEVIKQGVKVKQKSSNMLMIVNLYSHNNKYDGVFLNNYTNLNICDSILRIPGVGDAKILGGDKNYAMRIWLNPDKMNGYSLTVQDVMNALNEQNLQVAAGQIGSSPTMDSQQFQYTVHAKGRLTSAEEFCNIILKVNANGAFVRLKDVAKVKLGSSTYTAHGQLNGSPCANLAIYQLPNANALDIEKAVKLKMQSLANAFPKDLNYKVVYDTTRFVKSSLKEVVQTLFIAIIIVIFVVYIFLQDWRSALIPSIAIPVSLIGTFVILLILNYSINTITLFGLILAIGVVVDDAIVVIESVKRKMDENGLSAVDATKKSMKEVTGPIIATTLVLFAVFIPVAFIPGITGHLYRQFAVTIAVAVGISSLCALILSPALCVTLLRPQKKPVIFLFRWFNKFFELITEKYSKAVSLIIRKLMMTSIFLLLVVGAVFWIYNFLPTSFIPNEDQGTFIVNVQLPDAASLNRTEKVVADITKVLKKINGVDDIIDVSGFSLLTGTSSSNSATIICVLDDWSKRNTHDLYLNAILKKVNRYLKTFSSANAIAFPLSPIRGLGMTGGFEFVVQSTGNKTPLQLNDEVKTVIAKASKHPEIWKMFCTYRANTPGIYIDVNREKAKKLGISLGEIFNTLQAYLGSIYVNDFNKYGKVYKVMIQAEKKYRDDVNKIEKFYVKNNDGKMVSLDTLVSIKKVYTPQVINHYNMLPSATINGFAAKGYSSGEAIKVIEKIAKDGLHNGMRYSWTGTAYQEILAGNKVYFILILSIVFIYLFLVAQYESWLLSLAVIASVPFAFLGALLALWLVGINNNIYAQIGFVLLFGLSSKTAILMVEYAKYLRENGKSTIDAANFAAKLRFRAIVMTAITFVLGVLPLLFASGPGAVSRITIGVVVFGGMFLDLILGSLLTPVCYVIFQKIIDRNNTAV
jgi:hydrophobic/amphiphilic exporter-1 (mainly G- bacteria), HAE1 family